MVREEKCLHSGGNAYVIRENTRKILNFACQKCDAIKDIIQGAYKYDSCVMV